MNILKYLLPCITLLFFITTGVYAHDSDKKKNHNNDGKKYQEKMEMIGRTIEKSIFVISKIKKLNNGKRNIKR